ADLRAENIGIFGDSVSACQGTVPEGFEVTYPKFDVDDSSELWWGILENKTGGKVIQNNSYSGSTVSSKFASLQNRLTQLPINTSMIFLFMGTNDFSGDVALGDEIFNPPYNINEFTG